MSVQNREHHYSSERWQRAEILTYVAVGSLVTAGVIAGFFGAAGLLTQAQLLPGALSVINPGVYGSWILVGASAVSFTGACVVGICSHPRRVSKKEILLDLEHQKSESSGKPEIAEESHKSETPSEISSEEKDEEETANLPEKEMKNSSDKVEPKNFESSGEGKKEEKANLPEEEVKSSAYKDEPKIETKEEPESPPSEPPSEFIPFVNYDAQFRVAVRNENFEEAESLLASHNDSIYIDISIEGLPLLHEAVKKGKRKTVNFLLKHGVDKNRRDYNSRITPIGLAFKNNHTDIALNLLQEGAEIEQFNGEKSLIETAFEKGNTDLIKALFENDRDGSCLNPMVDALKKNVSFVIGLLSLMETDEIKKKYWPKLLHEAAGSKCKEVVRFILERGFDWSWVEKTDRFCPLHYAVLYNNEELFDLLLESGIDIEIMGYSKDWGTAFHLALQLNHFGFAKKLVEKGANVDSVNQKNETPFELAAQRYNTGAMEFLLENGANVKDLLEKKPEIRSRLPESTWNQYCKG